MFKNLRALNSKRLLKQQIEISTRTIYSEEFEFDAIVQRLCPKMQPVGLLRAYIAIQTAALLSEPLNDTIIDRAFESFSVSEKHQDSTSFGEIVNVHKELANIHWLERTTFILRGKLAHQGNEDSELGGIYALEFERKHPISREERIKATGLLREMAVLDKEIQVHELKALKDSDSAAYEEMKDEIEAKNLRDEYDRNEEVDNDSELKEILSMLNNKLATLLENGQA